ncbi:AraC family transcriptional regulator [Paenibacillus sp. NEAU-GSW1]|uniref:AraC family transcriptional regulator n=1 Tax=Paenibacillus sp. NEAU-GSW1 TaxID=2682486 RepID=UPI0012E29293|nr:AraC family transcriptional regulator [Paenibacillus sp. NEAU-GSW1]MUT65285.1 helix-turn-helix domain-containing protein [Paenibacillus sp. NEAU-GSW1]
MQAMRKPFIFSSPFPFDCNYRDRKHWQTELPDHLHDWHELVYIYDGKGTFFIDQTFYDMKRGDLFIIPGNTIHRSLPDKVDPVTSTAIFFSAIFVQAASLGDSFSYLRCFEHAKKNKSYKLEPTNQEQVRLERLIDDLQREREEKQPGYRQAVLLYLEHILLLLNRSIIPNASRASSESSELPLIGPQWMRDILLHINEHPEAPLTLAALAGMASVTPAHFSRVFKQLTGMNLTEYVTAKRIVLAKERLAASDDNIAVIAERCGFESLPHFHRMFKKFTGDTPSAYKKSIAHLQF